MKFYGLFICLPFLVVVLAQEVTVTQEVTATQEVTEQMAPEFKEEDRKFLQELPTRQAGLLARLMYTFRSVAKKDHVIQAALAEVMKPEYYTTRAKLYNLPSFRDIRTRMMSYDTLYELAYFYDPLLFVFDLAKPWKNVTPSFKPLFENPKFKAVIKELMDLVEKTEEILRASLKDGMAMDVTDTLPFVMSQEFANVVVIFSKLDLNVTEEFQLMTKDYGLKRLIDRLGIS